mmetsp:Transcript_16252/g.33413  ORF Transcript_16252/g.33413 Transcript_16252/m.33413 type:complete len:228 (-) Transcript_16252:7671-8354(-)
MLRPVSVRRGACGIHDSPVTRNLRYYVGGRAQHHRRRFRRPSNHALYEFLHSSPNSMLPFRQHLVPGDRNELHRSCRYRIKKGKGVPEEVEGEELVRLIKQIGDVVPDDIVSQFVRPPEVAGNVQFLEGEGRTYLSKATCDVREPSEKARPPCTLRAPSDGAEVAGLNVLVVVMSYYLLFSLLNLSNLIFVILTVGVLDFFQLGPLALPILGQVKNFKFGLSLCLDF